MAGMYALFVRFYYEWDELGGLVTISVLTSTRSDDAVPTIIFPKLVFCVPSDPSEMVVPEPGFRRQTLSVFFRIGLWSFVSRWRSSSTLTDRWLNKRHRTLHPKQVFQSLVWFGGQGIAKAGGIEPRAATLQTSDRRNESPMHELALSFSGLLVLEVPKLHAKRRRILLGSWQGIPSPCV